MTAPGEDMQERVTKQTYCERPKRLRGTTVGETRLREESSLFLFLSYGGELLIGREATAALAARGAT